MPPSFKGQLLSGAGNRFLVLDNRELLFPYAHASQLCTEFDTDGLLLLEPKLWMRVFNKDGSEASMCGNGLRCFAWFLRELKISGPKYAIQTSAGIHLAQFEGDTVSTDFPTPNPAKLIREGLYWIHTGVPHLVYFTEEMTEAQVLEKGRSLRFSPDLRPEGANVNFAQILKPGHLAIRTYERGVEGETPACGTGAVACSMVAHQVFDWQSPIFVTVRSGETLTVSFSQKMETISLQGPVTPITESPFLYSLNTLQ